MTTFTEISTKFNKKAEYFYIIRTPKFFENSVFKIGKTSQTLTKRFQGYDSGTEIFLCINVSYYDGGCDAFERNMIKLLRNDNRFKLIDGNEYFYCEDLALLYSLTTNLLLSEKTTSGATPKKTNSEKITSKATPKKTNSEEITSEAKPKKINSEKIISKINENFGSNIDKYF